VAIFREEIAVSDSARTPEQWRQLLTEYRASGLTQREFAERHGIKACTLQKRLYPQRRRRRAFVRVEVASQPDNIEIVVAGDLVVRCGRLPEPEYVARLRLALASC
jgi:hypothetical protein